VKIVDFRVLQVYQRARAAANRIFELSCAWPDRERFNLTHQIRKSSRSVCANIAEAWRKRLRYPAAWVSKLSDADGEAGETIVWLDFAMDAAYLPTSDGHELMREYESICAMLVSMMDHPEQWCGRRAVTLPGRSHRPE